MKVGTDGSHSARAAFLVLLLLPFFLVLSACPPVVTDTLATQSTDKLPPTVTVTSPNVGSSYTANVTVTGTITDDALKAGDGKGLVRSIDYSVANDILRKGRIVIGSDGTVTQDTSFGAGTISWDTASETFNFTISTVSPTSLRGLITLIIDATDANGNKASSTVQLSEGSGPVITLDDVTKDNLKYTAGTTVFTLSGTVANASDDLTHDDNIESIGWGVTGKNWGTTVTVVSGTTSYTSQNVGLIPTSNFQFDTKAQTFSTTFTIPFINDTSLILTVTATDKNGHTTVSTNYLVADISGPQMTFFSPTTNVYYSPSHYTPQTVSGNVAAASPATLSALTFQLSTTAYTSDVIDVLGTVNSETGDFTFPLLASGVKTATLQGKTGNAAVTITAVDSKGRPTVAQYNILMDNMPPVISNVTTTSNNATSALYAKAGDRITLAFQAVDALSGITVGSNNPDVTVGESAATLSNLGDGNFSTSYTVLAGDSGSLAFSITATDAAGNPSAPTSTVSSGTDVIIDNSPPTVVLSDDRGSTGFARQGPMVITATFAEANAIDETVNPPKITIGSFVTNAAMTKSSNKVWTYSWLVPPNNDGIGAGVSITAEDLAGNQVAGGVTTYTIDNTKPDVVLSDDQTDNLVKGNDVVTFTAAFTEANGISTSPAPKITIGTYGPFTMSVAGDNLHWTYQWTVPTGVNATEALSITATDVAGNPNTAVSGSRLSYIIDNTKPSVALTDDQTDAFVKNGDTVNMTAIFTEANGINETTPPKISISGTTVTNALMSRTDNLHWTYQWTVPTGDVSSAAVSITAFDVAGNANTAVTGTRTAYTIDNTKPSVVLSNNISARTAVKNPDVVRIYAAFTEANGITTSPVPQVTIAGSGTYAMTINGDNLHWYYDWTVPTGDVTSVAVSITASDVAGNPNTAATGVTTYTIDNTKPDVALSDDQTDNLVKGNDVVNFSAVFTESNGISTSPAPKITIGTYGPFTMSVGGDNLHWTYQWTVPTGVNAAEALSITATDVAGNPNTAATGSRLSYIIDNTKPDVTLSDDQTDNLVKGNDVVNFTAVFTESNGISTSPAPKITIGTYGPFTMSVGGDNLHWTYQWTVPTGVSATEALGITATDVAGNPNTAATGSRLSYIIDNTKPDVALSNNISARTAVKNPDVVRIYAAFTEANGITTSPVPQVTIAGSGTYAMTINGDNLHWYYDWTVPTGDVTSVAVSITASDVAGNPNTAATGVTTYTIDNTKPDVALSDDQTDNLVKGNDVVNFSAVFTESNGISTSPAPKITIGTYGPFTMSVGGDNLHWTYQWTVPTGVNAAEALSITATDVAGNPNTAATGSRLSYIIDNTKPDVTLSDDQTDNLVKGNDVVNFTAVFTESNGISTSPAPKITIGTYGPFTMSVGGDNLHWTYQWTVPTGVSATEALGITATDVAGNPNTAATGSRLSYIIDNTKPDVALSDDQTDATVKGNDVVNFTAVFTESNGISTSPAPKITIGTYGPFTMSVGGDNLHWTYQWTVPTGVSATEALSITATDVVGNPNTAVSGSRLSYTIDNTKPDVALSDDQTDNLVKGNDVVNFSAVFTESNGISTSPAPKITIGTYGPFTMSVGGDNLHWTYQWTVPTGVNATEALSITATDVAGNPNTAATGSRLSYIIDNTKPDVALSDDQTDNLVKGNDVVNFTAVFTESNGISTSPAPKITIGTYGPFTMSVGGDNLHWTYQWTVPTGVSATEALGITATDVAGNPNTAATGSRLSYIIDNTKPDVVLSDDQTDATVKGNDVVNFTAVFTESNGISTSPAPKITIGTYGPFTMSVGGDNLHWTYQWTVPTGVDATEALSITAADVVGNPNTAVSGSRLSYTIDNTPPSITALAYVGANTSWLVTFDNGLNGVYGDALPAHSTPLATTSITFADTTTGGLTATVSAVSHTAGNSTATYTVGWTGGSPAHNDVITATVVANSIYDAAGNVMSAGTSPTTGAAKLLSIFGIQTSPLSSSSRPATIIGRAANLIQSTLFGTVAAGSSASSVVGETTPTDQLGTVVSYSRPDAFQDAIRTPIAAQAAGAQATTGTSAAPATLSQNSASTPSLTTQSSAASIPVTVAMTPASGPQIASPTSHFAQPTVMPGTAHQTASDSLVPSWWAILIGALAIVLVTFGAWKGLKFVRSKGQK